MSAIQFILESPFRWTLNFGVSLARRVENQISHMRELAARRVEPNG